MHLTRMSEEEAVTRMPAAIRRSAELRRFHAHSFPRGGGGIMMPFLTFMKQVHDVLKDAIRIHEGADKHNNPDWDKEMQYLKRLEEYITSIIALAPKKYPLGSGYDQVVKPVFFSNVAWHPRNREDDIVIGLIAMNEKEVIRVLREL
jgi:hypothetical protein